jgi:hypothetical protein
MYGVAAFEVSDPLLLVVFVKANNSTCWRVDCRHRATAA